MKFSFLMCVNQGQPFLRVAVNSMLHQDYSGSYEVLIVANNCTDSLYEELLEFLQVSDKVRLYRTSIGQLAFNLNYGADLALGEYIVRMDADDVCLPDRLSKTLQMLERHNYPDVISGLARKIDSQGELVGVIGHVRNRNRLSKFLCFQNPIVHPATAIRRDSLIKVRGYLGGVNCEDYDLWLRMDRLGMEIIVADFYPIHYRVNDYQVSGSRIAYSDGVGLRLREALVRGSAMYLLGFFFALCKFFVLLALGRMK